MIPAHIREAIYHYLPHMDGWTTPERGCEMAEAIITHRLEICVEAGVFAGRSLISQGFAVRDNGFGMTHGIDPWDVESAAEGDGPPENTEWWKTKSKLVEMHEKTIKAIRDHRLEQWVSVIRSPSQYVAHLFPRIDFLNIDGCHSELASCRDVSLYVPRVRKDGIIFMDDTDWATTQKAIGMIEECCELISDHGKARTYKKL